MLLNLLEFEKMKGVQTIALSLTQIKNVFILFELLFHLLI